MIDLDEVLIDESAVLHDNGRDGTRHRLALQASIHTLDGRGGTYLTEDVSPTGLFVHIATPYAPGTPLHVAFVLPRSSLVQLGAVVAWNTNQPQAKNSNLGRRGMGLRFTHVPPAAARLLARYFASAPSRISASASVR